MLQFLKYVLATIVGLFLFSLLGLLILVGIGAAAGSSSGDDVSLKDNTVLKLDLNRAIVENASDDNNPFKSLGGPFAGDAESVGMVQIREGLKRAAADKHIKGIYLLANYPQAGYAQLEEIRNALLEFRRVLFRSAYRRRHVSSPHGFEPFQRFQHHPQMVRRGF